jgi:hypothetical protein
VKKAVTAIQNGKEDLIVGICICSSVLFHLFTEKCFTISSPSVE